MKLYWLTAITLILFICSGPAAADESIRESLAPLIDVSCSDCHDAATETGVNLEELGSDLSDRLTFQAWVAVYDQVSTGKMPPESAPQPEADQVEKLLGVLREKLIDENRRQQVQIGRVPARRLTKRELAYTLKDLLLIDRDVTDAIPAEVRAESFDTVGVNQRMSAVHMEGYLDATNQALELATRLGRNPFRTRILDFAHSPFLNDFHDKPLELGGSVSRRTDQGVALFRDVDYLLTSTAAAVFMVTPGTYKIETRAAAYQTTKPITLKIIRKGSGGATELLLVHDLLPGIEAELSVEAFLERGDSFYTTFEMEAEPFVGIASAGGVKNYKGPGIEIRSQTVSGPIHQSWPPSSTQKLLQGCEFQGPKKGPLKVVASQDWLEQRVHKFCQQAFRRPVSKEDIQDYLDLADQALQDDGDVVGGLHLAIKAILAAPQFLLFQNEPGELDPHALASRLSYFLWKSMPDDELIGLADRGELLDSAVLARQVDRMLADEKSLRFVEDFVGQWLRLDEVNATTPDEGLYPEFDELLNDSIPQETNRFVAHLIQENLSLTNLIDSDFTFVNRRLAQHYRLPDVEGQHFRKVDLPSDSVRGGVLTQAAILKTTANGTTTSPVMRGNFVITNLLGMPVPPPPPSVGSVEPDTRGKTTIREILAAHREMESCNKCHQHIDPPGFALESFDPIGGYRTRYRATGGGLLGFLTQQTYRQGPVVDASGVTSDGKPFQGIVEFKQQLMNNQDQFVRNLISQLVVYSTGGEIQFSDREEIDSILKDVTENGLRFRDMIHAVVQSQMFRHL